MTYVTCRLADKNRDQLRNPTLGNRVWATFTFFILLPPVNGVDTPASDSFKSASSTDCRKLGLTEQDHRGGRAQLGRRTFMMTYLCWILGYMSACNIGLSGD